ncbi:MAG: phosphate signaling complex protein PhoU [Gammaproteobacteria bacterium]|jgi:phosphate transport system protein|nr:phosphate signaling complex protein PhoU [Gammaproteobacteria bacterium]
MTLHFLREVDRLIDSLASFGEEVEDQLCLSIDSLLEGNVLGATRVINNDVDVDQTEVEIEEECLKLLALHQPLASDLRQIISVLKINCDLERVGDHATNIAERVLDLDKLPTVDIPADIVTMSKQARLMLRISLLSFVESDQTLTQGVFDMDKELDELQKRLFKQQLDAIQQVPAEAEQRILLLSICKQLERIGDLAANIAEDVVYLMSGEIIRHSEHESGC